MVKCVLPFFIRSCSYEKFFVWSMMLMSEVEVLSLSQVEYRIILVFHLCLSEVDVYVLFRSIKFIFKSSMLYHWLSAYSPR